MVRNGFEPATPSGRRRTGRTRTRRLYDVLFAAKLATRASGARQSDSVTSRWGVLPAGSRREPKHVWLHIGPGDEGEAVLAILMRDEN